MLKYGFWSHHCDSSNIVMAEISLAPFCHYMIVCSLIIDHIFASHFAFCGKKIVLFSEMIADMQ